MLKILALTTVTLLFQGCIFQKKVWNFTIINPQNNTTINQNSNNSVNVSGNFYLDHAVLSKKELNQLKNKM